MKRNGHKFTNLTNLSQPIKQAQWTNVTLRAKMITTIIPVWFSPLMNNGRCFGNKEGDPEDADKIYKSTIRKLNKGHACYTICTIISYQISKSVTGCAQDSKNADVAVAQSGMGSRDLTSDANKIYCCNGSTSS